MFWFFGPALAAVGCTYATNSYFETTVATLGGKAVATVCTAGSAVVGFFFAGPIETFGVIMAMAIGLLGWLTIWFILVISNGRIFKANASSALMMLLGLGLSELPILNVFPALTSTTAKMYHTQIKKEKVALKNWKKDQELLAQQQRDQQIAQMMMARRQGEIEEAEYRDAEEAKALAQEEIPDDEQEAT